MNQKIAGYSLVELLIVVGLGCVILGIGAPSSVALLNSYRLTTAAQSIATEMQRARLLAISRNSQVKMRFNQNARSYHLAETESGALSQQKYLPRGVRFLSIPRAEISFHSKGNAVPAGTVVLKNPSGATRVVVNPGGRVRRERHDG